jgi:hypothetical protein
MSMAVGSGNHVAALLTDVNVVEMAPHAGM